MTPPISTTPLAGELLAAREAALSLLDHNDPRWWAIKTERGDSDPLVKSHLRAIQTARAEAFERAAGICDERAEAIRKLYDDRLGMTDLRVGSEMLLGQLAAMFRKDNPHG